MVQAEIEAGTSGIWLAWTPRWLLSPTAMGTILADLEKRTASVKIMITSFEDRDAFTKNIMCCGGKHQWTDHSTEISPHTLGETCRHLGHITLPCLDIERLRCPLCAGPHITRNHNFEVTTCLGKGRSKCTHTIAKCTNCRRLHYTISVARLVQW